ncbi:beta-lactamase [Lentilactobacillus kisonensis DSM 19906 = JCM 15041]|uniref:Beta-lactamase n=1 Tax=Lentilactobacillus kisonensis DSM 19906 = JCM 15041 TaxID=1423766 RepID=A0A0R1NZT2_9LACO|nr:beta-lactamase [Lentilactobacillus kisonensis DSM 19906 = JCM 15041]
MLFLAGLLLAGSFMTYRYKAMASYNPILSSSNKRYDAQIVNQTSPTKGYSLYDAGPYYTSSNTRTADGNGSKYNNDYVRVMQTKTTKTGTYARLRYFNQYIGWMNVHGIKPATLSQVATATMQQYDAIGTALLAPSGSSKMVTVSNGFADMAHNTPNNGNGSVVYPLASLQKAMTGAMIQQLISASKLSPTTLLSKYYPQVPYSKNITIKQMLSMTSGLTNTDITPTDQMTENQAYSSVVKRLKSTNNHQFNYSDANYILLAGIIAKVTGKSYASNLQTNILDKLGMKNTVIVDGDQPTIKSVIAVGYTDDGKTNYANIHAVSLPRLSAIPGAGNLLSTPSDYYKFVLGLQDGDVLTAKQYQQLVSYGSVYSGGVYVTRSGVKYNNGSFGGTSFHTGYYASNNNYHLALVFTNQGPLANNESTKDFAKKMYDVATYY